MLGAFAKLFHVRLPDPEPDMTIRKFRQVLTVYLTNGVSIQKVIEAEDEYMGDLMWPGSDQLAECRKSFLDRAGHSGFKVGATFYPAWRIDRIEIGPVEDVE